jgi:hypothetical protein
MNRIKMDLFNKNELFIRLLLNGYDIRDKNRFRKINQLIDDMFKPMPEDDLRKLIKEHSPNYFNWYKRTEEIIENAINMYFNTQTKKQRNNHIRYIKAAAKLYIRIDEVLNRVDVLGIAFLIRMCEYDIYSERITEDLACPKWSSVKKIRKYIIDDMADGTVSRLECYGFWGKISNAKYIPMLVLNDSEGEDKSDWIETPRRGRGPKYVMLKDRIEWGAERIFKLITDYKKYNKEFYN